MLSREQILALPADRELDVLVHRKVMGGQCEHISPTPGEFGIDLDGWYDAATLGIGLIPMQVRRYSTSIAAAWLVVEEMRRRGWLLWVGPHFDGKRWSVQYKRATENVHDWKHADTPAEAICQAALIAVEATP